MPRTTILPQNDDIARKILTLQLRPCDIFLTHGEAFISKAIRVCTRSVGEKPSKVNHAGDIVSRGTLQTALAVEALQKVEIHSLWEQYADRTDKVAVFRPTDLSWDEKRIILDKVNSYIGRPYSYFKIFCHLMDFMLDGAYIFRRIGNMENYPICSWVVAQGRAAVGRNFGVDPGAAQPDDIWDYCVNHPDKYEMIFPLSRLKP